MGNCFKKIYIPEEYLITCNCQDINICNCKKCTNPNCDCFNLKKCQRCNRLMMKEEYNNFFGFCDYCRRTM